MRFWPGKAFLSSILIFSFTLASCQSNTTVPPATQEITPSGPTPPLQITLPVTTTPTVRPTETPVAHQNIDPGSFQGMQLDFWHPWQADLAKRTAEVVDQFNASNEWGITVRARSLYGAGALGEAVNESRGRDTELEGDPEIIAAVSDQLAALVGDQNGLVNLEDYVSHPKWGFSEAEVAAYHPVFWNQDRSGDERFGIPVLRSASVLFYNQTWAKDLGFMSPPKTPDEFKQQACAAAVANNQSSQRDHQGTGGYLVDTGPVTALSWLSVFGAEPFPNQTGKSYRFESEEGEAALSFLREMFEDGCAWLGRSPEPYDYFSRRMALFYSGSLTDTYIQKRVMAGHSNGDSWLILPFPGVDGTPLVYSSGYSLAVLPSQPNRQMAAWLFVRWMSQPSMQAKLGEVLPSIPVSTTVKSGLSDYQANFPWDSIFPMSDYIRPVPVDPSWRIVRQVLEDAFRQVFYLPAEQVKTVLPMIDETIEELQKRETEQ